VAWKVLMRFLVAVVVGLFFFLSYCDAKPKWHELSRSYSFEKYVIDFGKQYSSQEYNQRSQLFQQRLEEIFQHNSNPDSTWKKGVNQFTDQTEEEFSMLLGYNKQLAYSMQEERQKRAVPNTKGLVELAEGVDWRLAGIISEVKDQGRCGSCWAFGTAEIVESYWANATGQLGALSIQQILDCTPNPQSCGGTGGCGGGTPELAYAQIINTGGLSSEWTYSYQSYYGSNFPKCFFADSTPAVAFLSNFTVLPSNQYEPVITAVSTVGPLAVNVDAGAWSSYETGVFSGCNQTNPDINHVVNLVGYGVDPRLGPYYLIRNSWTPAWGEAGYIRLARSSSPPCGEDLNPMDGTGCTGGPARVQVCGECGILYDVSYPIIQN